MTEASLTGSRSGLRAGGATWLQWMAVALALGPLFDAFNSESSIPADIRITAACLWASCWLPAWFYLRAPASRRPPIPFLPIIGVLYGLCFALQVALGYPNQFYRIETGVMSPVDPGWDYAAPVRLALLGWFMCLIAYGIGLHLLPRRPVRSRLPWRPEALARWGIVLLFMGLAFDSIRNFPVPLIFKGVVIFGSTLALFGAALLIVLRTEGVLSLGQTLLLLTGVLVLFVQRLAAGSVSGVVYLAAAAVLAYWLAAKRLNVVIVAIILILLACVVTVRGIIIEFRSEVWYGNVSYTTLDRTELLRDLVSRRVEQVGVWRTIEGGAEVVIGRSAYLDLFADVVRQTPRNVPYWRGETYLSLIGIAVPRFLWPSKPTKVLGQEFGHRYNYLYDQDVQTSINLPFLIEFYMNFGPAGIVLGMAIVGLVYALLHRLLNNPGQPVEVSILALVLLLPLYNIESDFSLVFGGLILNGIALHWTLRFLASRIGTTLRAPVSPLVLGQQTSAIGTAK